jgi:hypothetical protein
LRIRTLSHLLQYSTLIPSHVKSRLADAPVEQLRRTIDQNQAYLSEFSDFLSGKKKLNVPVFAVWGACEDVSILEKFRSKEYSIPNLNILDEATTHLLEIGGVNLRLFGLGGAVVQHKLFDNGEGKKHLGKCWFQLRGHHSILLALPPRFGYHSRWIWYNVDYCTANR